ncbi:MAG: glycosyltransferase [Bryobacteraceae bacterium]|jgi:glycosyltransferase involved in cell wall biosynthesis
MQKPSPASAGKPELLFLSPEPPYPTVGGGAIRTASLLEFLALRFAIDLILFAEDGSPDPAAWVPLHLVRRVWTLRLPEHRKNLPARIGRNLARYLHSRPPLMDRFSGFDRPLSELLAGRRYAAAVMEHFWCAPYVHILREHCGDVWLDLHNVESVWHARLAGAENWLFRPALRSFAAVSRRLEYALLPQFSRILVPSATDASEVAAAAGGVPVTVYPNALPWIDPPVRSEDDAIIFTGNLEYAPNVTAICWFFRHVWPWLRRWRPGLVWRIVGRNPRGIRRYIESDRRIELIGPVENAIAEIARAKVAVVPVLAGSGTRFKIIEAWAAGTPVVSTTIGAEGLGAEHERNILIADSSRDMRETIAALLRSDQRRATVGAAGRALYQERFTWAAAWRTLESSGVPGSVVEN